MKQDRTEELPEWGDNEALKRLSADMKEAARTLRPREARYLVDLYYQLQRDRISSANIIRSGVEGEEPSQFLLWMLSNQEAQEQYIRSAMKEYAGGQVVGRWSMSICGIGPVIAAGLMAHIDIEQAPTVGHIWSFAGLDPTREWKGRAAADEVVAELLPARARLTEEIVSQIAKRAGRDPDRILAAVLTAGEGSLTRKNLVAVLAKRPYNARLKTLCWKIGESFVKQKGRDADIYGKVYEERRALEDARNEAGEYQGQAEEKLRRFKIGKDTAAYGHYSNGLLPPGHLHMRAKRYAVKLFLAHWHHVAHEARYGRPPVRPYIIEREGHAHFIKPPNWPLE